MSTGIRYVEGIANDSRRHEGGEKSGIRRLWVDALCIIQDSNQSKIQELSVMHQISENSSLTIVAASSKLGQSPSARPSKSYAASVKTNSL